MNVGQIKASPGDQKNSVHPDVALKKQLQQSGLKQAAEFQQQHATSVSVSSTQTIIGLKVFSHSLEQSVTLDGQKAKPEGKDKEDKSSSLFDFEKVARNVLRFVGGVIGAAAKSGADESRLGNLFSQARQGVSKGIAMAERDIGGLMNDEIAQGIERSRNLIEGGLSELEQKLIGAGPLTGLQQANAVELAAADSKEGSLRIRTRDGDEVRLSFESLQQFRISQQQMQAVQVDGEEKTQSAAQQSTSYAYYESSGVSFSLRGELDEGELKAIADLVEQANDLADTFFGGDLDQAFEQALQLGFDDQELTGYALQLNRIQQAQAVQTYEDIRHYRDDNPDEGKHGNTVRPIAQYLDKMMDVFAASEQKLESENDYHSLLNGLITQMEEVQVPDLIYAINRFHSFNQRLMDSLPAHPTAENE